MPWSASVAFFYFFFFQQPPGPLDLPNVSANPHTSPADVEQGRKLYAGRCAGCHGPGGDGGKGANLAVPVLPRAASDLALYRVVRYGLPETEMPATLLAPREVWQIAAFVRTLASSSGSSSSGDAKRGAAVARSSQAGCLNCHAIGLEGGRLGPALSDIGARRGPGHLRAKLVDANSDIADTFRMVELTTRGAAGGGRKVSGVRLNEDVYSIQLRDASGAIHSFWKRDLASLRVERRTPMPSYQGKLSAAELDDLIAYLTSLRGGATNQP